PSARLDTRGTKVALEFRAMRRRKMLMTWTMNSIISMAMAKVQSGRYRDRGKMLTCLHLLATNNIGFPV
ncbi:hypothetical protein L9G15_24050, partial [Shewanella sp. A3A]|nr:hypothetical protein [Shewanella ferrihydritica]